MSASHGKTTEVHQVGPHVIELEPPDIVQIHYMGDMELVDFLVLDEIIAKFAGPAGVYLIRDARRGGFVAKETREYVGRRAYVAPINYAITYSGSFQARTVFQLMTAGTRRVKGQGCVAVFVDTEADARAWIAKHREMDDDANPTNE